MAVTLYIAYPKGAELNIDYYISKHIPMVKEAWKNLDPKEWKLETAVGGESPYELVATVKWESAEALGKLQTDVAPELQKTMKDDLANYSKQPPQIWAMEEKSLS